MTDEERKRMQRAKRKAQKVGHEVLETVGDSVRVFNEDILPEPLALVNPLTIFEDTPEAQSARQGVTFGWSDELAGLIGGDALKDEARKEIKAFREDRPLASLGLETAGSLATPGGYFKGLGGLLKLRGLAPMAYGAAGGAAYGSGTAEDDEKLKGGLIGGGFGALAGGLGSFVLDPAVTNAYSRAFGKHIPRPDPNLDIYIDPSSIPEGILYHTTPASRVDDIMREGVRRRSSKTLGGMGDDFTFLSQEGVTPEMRALVSEFAKQTGDKAPVQTLAIDASRLQPGRLMADRYNVPRRGLYNFAPYATESPGNVHRLLQYADDIPPDAIMGIVPEDRLGVAAGDKLKRAPLSKTHRAKTSGGTLGAGDDAVRALTPDEALDYLRKAAREDAARQ